jgi:hypothetical protein
MAKKHAIGARQLGQFLGSRDVGLIHFQARERIGPGARIFGKDPLRLPEDGEGKLRPLLRGSLLPLQEEEVLGVSLEDAPAVHLELNISNRPPNAADDLFGPPVYADGSPITNI